MSGAATDLQAEADAESGDAQLDLGNAAGQQHDGQAAQLARLPHRRRSRCLSAALHLSSVLAGVCYRGPQDRLLRIPTAEWALLQNDSGKIFLPRTVESSRSDDT